MGIPGEYTPKVINILWLTLCITFKKASEWSTAVTKRILL